MNHSRRPLTTKIFRFFSSLLWLVEFVMNHNGREYGITKTDKLKLSIRIIQNTKKVKSLSTWRQHLVLVDEIFNIPKSLVGAIVECGCYNGASTVNLSLACALTGRELIVCDSFEGLPEPRREEKYDIHAFSTDYYVWERGDFSSNDGLNGVKLNVEQFGDIRVCRFLKGYFQDTLPNINTESIVLIFEDADIASSVEDCLRFLWPKLQDGCKFFCHEPWSIHVVSLFYDEKWWKNNIGSLPPGFYGSGYGTIAGLGYSSIGFAKKFDHEKIRNKGDRILHEGSTGFEN